MMKTHRASKIRSLSGATALSLLILSGLGLSAPGFAQEQDKEKTVVQDVIIKRVGKDGKGVTFDGKSLDELMAKCAAGKKEESDVTSGEGKEKFRTRVIICSNDKTVDTAENREKLAKALDRARDRIGEHDALSEKGRTQAIDALEREIARLRSQGK